MRIRTPRKPEEAASQRPSLPLTVSKPELLSASSDQEFRQLVHDTLAFSARIQEVRNRLAAAIGLSGPQYTVLITVAHHQHQPGGVGINQVAEHLHLSGAFVTIEINKLIAKGLVTKETNPEDRRRVLLRTTGKAHALFADLAALQRPTNDTLFGCLSKSDFRRLRVIMASLVESADRSLSLLDYLTCAGPFAATDK